MGAVAVPMSESRDERELRRLTEEMKTRLHDSLLRSGKGQNEVAREVGASNSVASEWFSKDSDVLPGGKFLMRLPQVLGVNGHWLITGEGSRYPQPTTGRKDIVFMEGLVEGAKDAVAEFRRAAEKVEREIQATAKDTAAKARAALDDADEGDTDADEEKKRKRKK